MDQRVRHQFPVLAIDGATSKRADDYEAETRAWLADTMAKAYHERGTKVVVIRAIGGVCHWAIEELLKLQAQGPTPELHMVLPYYRPGEAFREASAVHKLLSEADAIWVPRADGYQKTTYNELLSQPVTPPSSWLPLDRQSATESF